MTASMKLYMRVNLNGAGTLELSLDIEPQTLRDADADRELINNLVEKATTYLRDQIATSIKASSIPIAQIGMTAAEAMKGTVSS